MIHITGVITDYVYLVKLRRFWVEVLVVQVGQVQQLYLPDHPALEYQKINNEEYYEYF